MSLTVGTLVGYLDLDGSKFDRGIDQARSSFSGLAGTLDQAGGRIVDTFTKWGKRAGVALTGVLAASVTGGVRRLMALEDASSMLAQMGLSAQQSKRLMDALNNTLTGTPFALDAGASAMAMFVSSGMGLDRIPGVMDMVTDAAGFAKAPLNEIADIFNQIALGNRLTATEMNRLQARGVPALSLLASAAGVSEAKFREMISAGKIDAATFFKLWEKGAAGFGDSNIIMAGAAKSMGDTTRGAFANMMTAFSRFGARMAGPIFAQAKHLFMGISAMVGDLGSRLEPFAEQIATRLVAAFQTAAAWVQGTLVPALQQLGAWLSTNREMIQRLAAAIGPAVAVVAGLATSFHLLHKAWLAIKLATPLGLLTALVGGLIYAWQNSERFREIVTAAFEQVQAVVGRVAAVFAGSGGLSGGFDRVRQVGESFVGWLRGVLGAAVEWLGSVWESIGPRFAAIGESFAGIAETLAPVAAWLGEKLPQAFQALWSIAQPIIGFLVGLIGDTLKMAINGVVQVFQGAVKAIEGILNVFAGLFTGDWSRMWEGVKQIGQGIWDAIVGLVKTWLAVSVFKVLGSAMSLIRNLFSTGWQAIRNIFTSAGNGIVSTVRGWVETIYLRVLYLRDGMVNVLRAGWETVRTVFSGGVAFIRQVVQAGFALVRNLIRTAMTAVRTTISNAMTGIRTSVSNGVNNVLTFFREMPSRILSAIGDLSRLLWNVGKSIIDGLIGGITAGFQRVKDTLGNLTNMLPDWKGPLAVDRKLLTPVGETIMGSLARGFERQFGPVERMLAGYTGRLAGAAAGAVQIPTGGLVAGAGMARELVVRDVDGALIGRMRVEADRQIDGTFRSFRPRRRSM